MELSINLSFFAPSPFPVRAILISFHVGSMVAMVIEGQPLEVLRLNMTSVKCNQA